MIKTKYLEAVDWATDVFTTRGYPQSTTKHAVEPSEYRFIYGLNIVNHEDDHPLCKSYYTYPEGAFLYLASQAASDKGAFDIARRLVTSRLLRNEKMDLHERTFAAHFIGGMISPPPPEGKRIASTFALNLNLVLVTRMLVKNYGLKLSRNDEVLTKESACDAVSHALKNIGMHKSWRAIKDLHFHKSSERVREAADEIEDLLSEYNKNP